MKGLFGALRSVILLKHLEILQILQEKSERNRFGDSKVGQKRGFEHNGQHHGELRKLDTEEGL